MARPIDPARQAARRAAIMEAALTQFAAHGYEGATTAAICRTAEISSGAFFHYFPSKLDVLVALLDVGHEQTAAWFAGRPADDLGLAAVHAWVEQVASDLADPRTPAFIRAVGATLAHPRVTEVLQRDDDAQRAGLVKHLTHAQEAGSVRTDLPPEALCSWVLVLLDGLATQVEADPSLVSSEERPHLHNAVDRLLAP